MKPAELRKRYLMGRMPTMDLQQFVLNGSTAELRQCYELTLGQSTYLPPIQFRRKWATFLIKQLDIRRENTQKLCEDEYTGLDEICDDWYNALGKLSTLDPQTEPFYRLYDVKSSDKEEVIKIFENEDMFVCNGTTGLITWDASIQLAKYFASHPQDLESINWIIELGSGCGYLAIAIIKLKSHPHSRGGLQKYVLTEGSSDALIQCQKNVSANFPENETSCPVVLHKIDWTSSEDTQEFTKCVEEATLQHGTGCLIGADIIFDPELIPYLCHLFNTFLRIQASYLCFGRVLLNCEARNQATFDLLTRHLYEQGRRLEHTPWNTGNEKGAAGRMIAIT